MSHVISWESSLLIILYKTIFFLTNDGWKYVGYQGLASHGGTFGLIVALWFYIRKTKLSIWRVLDNIAIATGTTACSHPYLLILSR